MFVNAKRSFKTSAYLLSCEGRELVLSSACSGLQSTAPDSLFWFEPSNLRINSVT